MFNDSDIISYSLYSLENGTSELSNKTKYYKPNDNLQDKKYKNSFSANFSNNDVSHSSTKTNKNNSNKKLAFFKRELKTFCCFICFLTRFKFHSLKIYLTLICLMALFTQMIQGGYISAIITSVQNHFNLSTSKVGYILSSYDIMSVIATPIISYIGSRFNKARIIGICGFSYVIGAIVFILPYYLGPKYTVNTLNNKDFNTMSNNLCSIQPNTLNKDYQSNETTEIYLTTTTTTTSIPGINCHRDFSYTWPFYVFIASQLLMSIGVAPMFPLGTTYLCDNLEERLHAFYTGILYAFYALGPAVGYLTASYFLSKWINYFQELAPINESDPRWVGLWYLGFFISAGGILVISILMLTFPDHLKDKGRKLKKKKEKKIKNNSNSNLSNTNRIFGNNEVAIDFNNNNNNRRLETIDEVSEIVDKNFEFLDSISARIDHTVINSNPQPSGNVNLVVPNDSVSTQFYQNSYSSRSSVLNKMASESSSVAIVGNKKLRNTLSSSISHRIVHTKLKLSGFLKSLLKLFLNYRYTLLILVISTDCVLLSAFTNYMILYSQNLYQLSSSKSSILVGGVIVPAAIIGAVLGGFIVRRFNFDIEGCTRLIMISSMLVLGGIFALIFVKCESVSSIGIDSINNGFNSTSKDCNKYCNCDSTYNPVCGIDGKTYVSPCYIGCTQQNKEGYQDCSCISSSDSSNSSKPILAKQNACPRGCDNKMIIFLIVLFLVVATESMCMTPATILVLKIIDKPLQSLALGVMRSYIPAPIVLSQVIDGTCILWSSKCVGDKGTCLEYNTSQFHIILFGSSAGIKIVSCCLLITFTFFIHKSYLRKRHYIKKVKLNHDITSVLTPKQKYMIDSEVASLNASTATTQNKIESKTKTGKKKSWVETVVLKSQRSFQEEEFTSFDRSQTPDYFLNKAKIDGNNENRIDKLDSISIKHDQLNENILNTSNF